MLETALNAASANLLAPPLLFFALGAFAGWAKSDLSIPDQAAKALSLYLMLCIGFKGGVEAQASGLGGGMLAVGGLGLAFSFLTPFAAYAALRTLGGLQRVTAAATAAHYGSVSVVTFAAGSEFLRTLGVEFSGHMAAVLALMETPAILAALVIAGSSARDPGARFKPELWREVLLNGAAVLLVGSFFVGLLAGERGMERLSGFVGGPIFQGALCLFLLDMGIIAARRLADAPLPRPGLLAFALGVGLTAFGGAVILPYVTVFPGVGGQFVVLMFTVVVLGGLGSVAGAVVGGLSVGVIQALSSLFFPIQLQNLILFIVFIIVLAVRPQGLVGASR
eukprot:gene32529-43459_t